MRFGLAGGGFGEDFARCGIDDSDGVGEFGADVEQAVGSEGGLVRAQRLAEFDGGGELTLLQVDDVYGGAVGAGLSDSGIAVDGDIGETGVRGDSDFVAVDADGNFGEFAAGFGVDEEHGVFFLIGNDEDAA